MKMNGPKKLELDGLKPLVGVVADDVVDVVVGEVFDLRFLRCTGASTG